MRAKQKPPPHVEKVHFAMTLTAKQRARMEAGKLESSPDEYGNGFRTQDAAIRLDALRRAEALREEREMRKATEWF